MKKNLLFTVLTVLAPTLACASAVTPGTPGTLLGFASLAATVILGLILQASHSRNV